MKPWLYGTAALPPIMRGCLAPPFEPLAAGGIGRAARLRWAAPALQGHAALRVLRASSKRPHANRARGRGEVGLFVVMVRHILERKG